MTKSIIIFVSSVILFLSCAKTEKFETDNRSAIEYLENKYHIQILSTPIVLTDSLVAVFEEELLKHRKGWESEDAHKSPKNTNKNDYTKAGEDFPINCKALSKDEYFDEIRLRITSSILNSNQISVIPQISNKIPSVETWTFDGVMAEWDTFYSKVIAFTILGTRDLYLAGLHYRENFNINGTANHSECLMTFRVKFE